MKNLRSYLGGIAMLALGLCFTACSDDDGPEYSKTVLQNTELKAILVSQGYQFNEQGNLLLDDKANQTTSLDLSGTNISQDALSELSILPNLTDVNLSNNGYKMSFDFSKLPNQITGVNLTDNEIYEYPGLVNITTQENGDENVTVLHNLTKLYLPESAKYNCDEIVYYYENAKDAEIKIEDTAGNLNNYTTLREVPDADAREQLQTIFPSFFEGDYIDISKRVVNVNEIYQDIVLQAQNIEGFEYIYNNRSYKGASIFMVGNVDVSKIPYFKVKSDIISINIQNVTFLNDIDWGNALKLYDLTLSSCNGVEDIDLSASLSMGQGKGAEYRSVIVLENCPNLKELVLPTEMDRINRLVLAILPSLKNINMEQIKTFSSNGAGEFSLINLAEGVNLVYPVLDEDAGLIFAVSEDVYKLDVTRNFLDKYHKNFSPGSYSLNGQELSYLWLLDYLF